jgi:hypothetical protein
MRIVTKIEGNEETRIEEIIKKGTDEINETIDKTKELVENIKGMVSMEVDDFRR